MSRSRAAALAAEINKMMGTDVLRRGSDPQFVVKYLSTGLLPVDMLLQGGLPTGRFVVMTGAWSTLKSYIGLHAIATTQRAGGVCALVDTEHAYDPEWAEAIGVDVDSLLLVREETGEQALDVCEVLVRNGVDLVVFDSVAAALPKAEAEKSLDDSVQPARQAALFSRACRKLTAANRNTSFLWINQLREQIGITFGPTERAPGGRALPYYASIMVNIRKAGKVTRDIRVFTGDKEQAAKREIGQTFRAVVEKSKLNAPTQEVYFDFQLEGVAGINLVKFLFSQGVQLDLIEKRGNSWSYKSAKGASKEKFLAALAGDSDALLKLETEVREHYGLTVSKPRAGRRPPAKKSVAKSSAKSSAAKGRGLTPVRAQAASATTGARKLTSSKSRTR